MPVHCLYGTETDTDEAYLYDVPRFTDTTPPAPMTIINGPGDGTVNLRSLQACDRLGPQVYHRSKPSPFLSTLVSTAWELLPTYCHFYSSQSYAKQRVTLNSILSHDQGHIAHPHSHRFHGSFRYMEQKAALVTCFSDFKLLQTPQSECM